MLLPVGMRTLPLPLPPLPMCPGIDSSLNYPLDLVKRFQLCTGFCVCTNTCILTEGNRNANASRQAFVHWPSWCCLTGCGEESTRKLVLVLPADGTEMCWYKKLQILFFFPLINGVAVLHPESFTFVLTRWWCVLSWWCSGVGLNNTHSSPLGRLNSLFNQPLLPQRSRC